MKETFFFLYSIHLYTVEQYDDSADPASVRGSYSPVDSIRNMLHNLNLLGMLLHTRLCYSRLGHNSFHILCPLLCLPQTSRTDMHNTSCVCHGQAQGPPWPTNQPWPVTHVRAQRAFTVRHSACGESRRSGVTAIKLGFLSRAYKRKKTLKGFMSSSSLSWDRDKLQF